MRLSKHQHGQLVLCLDGRRQESGVEPAKLHDVVTLEGRWGWLLGEVGEAVHSQALSAWFVGFGLEARLWKSLHWSSDILHFGWLSCWRLLCQHLLRVVSLLHHSQRVLRVDVAGRRLFHD